jgi:hypothetical protein
MNSAATIVNKIVDRDFRSSIAGRSESRSNAPELDPGLYQTHWNCVNLNSMCVLADGC